jgi:hypothetical protein
MVTLHTKKFLITKIIQTRKTAIKLITMALVSIMYRETKGKTRGLRRKELRGRKNLSMDGTFQIGAMSSMMPRISLA